MWRCKLRMTVRVPYQLGHIEAICPFEENAIFATANDSAIGITTSIHLVVVSRSATLIKQKLRSRVFRRRVRKKTIICITSSAYSHFPDPRSPPCWLTLRHLFPIWRNWYPNWKPYRWRSCEFGGEEFLESASLLRYRRVHRDGLPRASPAD